MQFEISINPASTAAYLPQFLEIAGQTRWKKRAVQLASSSLESPFLAKIVSDYNWLELELSNQMVLLDATGRISAQHLTSRSLSALYFVGTVVEVYDRLSPRGRVTLEGRIRDSMNPNTGFAGLYLEIEVAAQLMAEGFDIEFPDLEGSATHDLDFSKGGTRGEVECKSLSFDAGRKIHRKDFYRLIEAINPEIVRRVEAGSDEVILVTVKDRLLTAMEPQSELRSAILRLLTDPSARREAADWFVAERIVSPGLLGTNPPADARELYRAYTDAFGANCHVAGAVTEEGACMIVARSEREDDHSKPLLEAIKKATTQLTATAPGFIVVQFDDICPDDLQLPHVRDRMSILSGYLVHTRSSEHLAALCFRAYEGLTVTPRGIGQSYIAIWNPIFRGDGAENLPFRSESSSWWGEFKTDNPGV